MNKFYLSILATIFISYKAYALFIPGKIMSAAKKSQSEIVVRLKKNSRSSIRLIDTIKPTSKKRVSLSYGDLMVLKFSHRGKLVEKIKKLRDSKLFSWVEENHTYHFADHNRSLISPYPLSSLSSPADPLFVHQWGHENTGHNEPLPNGDISTVPTNIHAQIQALKAWDINLGSKKVNIAVIDTGIDLTHPDLKNQLWVNEKELNGKPGVDDDGNGFVDDIHGYDFVNNDSSPNDDQGHGSHCAGIIGAIHNTEGIAGVMKDVSLMAIKFLDENGSGTMLDAVKSVDYAVQNGAQIISASWGGGENSQALLEAIKNAGDKGVVFVAAAGNDSMNIDRHLIYPASYELDNIISVAALNAQNGLAYFSNYGKKNVDITAPGHNIISTVHKGQYEVFSGTSMATPYVAGVLGLFQSRDRKRLPISEIKEQLFLTSEPIKFLKKKTVSGGRLNAFNFLTDFKPPRVEPDASLWKTKLLKEPFESRHPYLDNSILERTIKIPGAKHVRVILSNYELEDSFDFLQVYAGKGGEEIDRITGEGPGYVTEYSDGDEIHLKFDADFSKTGWGFFIEEVQYIE